MCLCVAVAAWVWVTLESHFTTHTKLIAMRTASQERARQGGYYLASFVSSGQELGRRDVLVYRGILYIGYLTMKNVEPPVFLEVL